MDELTKQEPTPEYWNGIWVEDIKTGNKYRVFKMIDNVKDGEIHIWCNDWYGHHVVGFDCELIF